ncbi:efflux transporter outer membrane subunit [Marinagarivorans algicola]|uniref:efflux transporter outer membrane subunit n=1 Tax=Marinagarivorans algicola TaxID=1513270 RepID=UPI0037358FD2
MNINLSLTKRFIKTASLTTLALAISACSTFKSPNEVRASADLSAAAIPFTLPVAQETAINGQQPIAQWWALFNDEALNSLIENSLQYNHSIRIAAASLAQSRAYLRNSQLDYLPTVEADVSAVRQRQSADIVGDSGSRISDTYIAGFDARWELDLFGRVRNGARASHAQVGASLADLYAAQVSIAAEVASTYINVRGHQYLRSIAQKNASIWQQTLTLAQRFSEVGSGDQLNVARATSQLALTRASIPALEAKINSGLNRLSVLTGNKVTSLKSDLTHVQALPSLPATVSVGNPQDLIKRRPDIQRAEYALTASVAQYNIRVADLYPNISFTGGLGYLANDWSRLSDSNTSTFLFSPRIHWAAFNLGRVHNQIKAADANTQARLAEFEQRVLIALEETDNNLQNFTREEQRRASLQQAANASGQAAILASKKFALGSSDFLSVLDAQREQLNVNAQLAQSDIKVLLNLIAIYKTLGGGWQTQTQTDT